MQDARHINEPGADLSNIELEEQDISILNYPSSNPISERILDTMVVGNTKTVVTELPPISRGLNLIKDSHIELLGDNVVIVMYVRSSSNNTVEVWDYSKIPISEEQNPRKAWLVSLYNKNFIRFMKNANFIKRENIPNDTRDYCMYSYKKGNKYNREEGFNKNTHEDVMLTFYAALEEKLDQWYTDNPAVDFVIYADKVKYTRFFNRHVDIANYDAENENINDFETNINGEDTLTIRSVTSQYQVEALTESELIRILGEMRMFKFVPTLLPYDHFDNNIPEYENVSCYMNMVLRRFTNIYGGGKSGKYLSPKNIAKIFVNGTLTEVVRFCKNYNIRLHVCDVFGNTYIKKDFSGGKKNRNDLNFMYFNGHCYPYDAKKNFETVFKMDITKFNDNLFLSNSIGEGGKISHREIKNIKAFTKLFTNNYNYESEENLCTRSLRYVGNIVAGGNYDKTTRLVYKFRNLGDVPEDDLLITDKDIHVPKSKLKLKQGNKCDISGKKKSKSGINYYKMKVKDEFADDGYYLFDLDMKKAFYNVMMTLNGPCSSIPIFSVESVIQEFTGDQITSCDLYFLSEEVMRNESLQKRGIYNNVHHGFVIKHLLVNKLINIADITHTKKHTSIYSIDDYRKHVNEAIAKIEVEDETKAISRLNKRLDKLQTGDNTFPHMKEINRIRKEVASNESDKTFKELLIESTNSSIMDTMVMMDKVKKDKTLSKPQKYAKINEIRRIISRYSNDYEFNESVRNGYMLYNGIMGRKRGSNMAKTVRVYGEMIQEDEQFALLKTRNPNLHIVQEHDQDGTLLMTEISQSSYSTRYLYFNNRNIYDFCISMCNWFMLKFYDDLLSLNTTAEIIRVYTDSLTFLIPRSVTQIKLTEQMYDNMQFKYDISIDKLENSSGSSLFTDPCKIIEAQNIELDDMAEKVTSITGGPGTGKTHKVKNEMKGKYNFAMTITNTCCRNMDTQEVRADTIYSQLQMHHGEAELSLGKRLKRFIGKTIWFDEFSMFSANYFNYIYLLTKLKNASIILTGDSNQIGPVEDGGYDPNNKFYAKLFKNDTKLVENHRVKKTDEDGNTYIDEDCQKLLDTINELVTNINDEYETKVTYSTLRDETFKKSDIIKVKTHLVFTNIAKNMINNYIYDTLGHKFIISANATNISVRYTSGLRLMVNESRKKNEIYKSVIYETLSDVDETFRVCDNATVKLKNICTGVITDIEVRFLQLMVLGFAVTTHSAQGLTIRERCVIHEAKKMINHDTRLFYTAISRMTKFSDVVLPRFDNEFEYKDKTFRKFKSDDAIIDIKQ